MLTPKEAQTVQFYDTHAESWDAGHHRDGFWKKEMDFFQSMLPHGKILEIGCGAGRDAKELIERGYEYLGFDPSKGLLALAQKTNPNAEFLLGDVYTISLSQQFFDGFWASASLLHIPKKRMHEALLNIRSWTKKDGVGCIILKEGKGERMVSEPEGGERFFAYYSQEEFGKYLKKAGLKAVFAATKEMGNTDWLIFFVKA